METNSQSSSTKNNPFPATRVREGAVLYLLKRKFTLVPQAPTSGTRREAHSPTESSVVAERLQIL